MFFGFLLHFLVVFAGDETNGVLAGAREFDQHDLFKGGFAARRERLIDLLDGAVDFVEQGDTEQGQINQLNQFLAKIVTRQAAHQTDQQHRQQQGDQAPIPMHRAGAKVLVSPFLGQKNQQRIGDVRHGAEQPDHNRDRNHRRQHDGQAGKKIGAPTRERILLHGRTVGLRANLLKGNRRASSRTRRSSSRFIARRNFGCRSS